METMDGIQPTYNLAENGEFGGSGFWIFALLILAFMGGNGGFFGGGSRGASVEDLNNVSNFGRLESQVQANGNLTETKIDNVFGQLSTMGYEMAQQIGSTNEKMATGFCSLSKEILESRYLNAQAIAEASAKTTADIQSVKDMIQADKIATLQAQVQQLQLQQSLCGVVRYPTTATYPAPNPFGCGGCNGNI